MTEQELRDSMHAKVERRFELIKKHVLRVHHQIDTGQIGGEAGRIWLEQFCTGQGVQICAGDFPIADALGIDTDIRKLGMDLWAFADRYVGDMEPLDYVVTNCLEYFPDTLRMLTEYGRMMEPHGTWAIVARDAEAYEEDAGPLENKRRVSCFTITTLRCYLARAGFEVFRWENAGKELRVAARKR